MKKLVSRYFRRVAVSLVLVTATLGLGIAQAGDVLTLKDGAPKTYLVKKGDTLWDISQMYLNDPWLWPEIWHVNPQVDNPHLIFPGDILNLVYIDGKPKLVVKRGKDLKLNPQIRLSDLDLAIPAIPLDAVSPFLTNSRVVSAEDLKLAPYVLAGNDGHIISGAGDNLYARGNFPDDTKAFGIFRPGGAYLDPETEELLGYQAFYVASAKMTALDGGVATLGLNQASEEVRRGDRLLPDIERNINSNFYPSAPEQKTNGYIIAVEGGVSQIGSMDVVVINKGERDGLTVGHVLAIYKVGEKVRDPVTGETVKVPDTRSGLMMVFRTFDKVSYGLVLKATRSLAVMDKVKKP